MGIVTSLPFSNLEENEDMFPCSQKNQKFVEDTSFQNFFDNPISDELLIEILSFVPERDLILNCQLVCKLWKSLIDEQSIWRRKCEREDIKISNISRAIHPLPRHYYRYVYQYYKSKKNLLKNPCGEDNLAGWQILQSGGNGLTTEKPPAGCDPVPAEVGSESCFATSYQACAKLQVIDLYEEEYNKYLLLNNLVTIKVGEWYGARFDCGSLYELKVRLLNDSSKHVDEFKFRFQCEQWDGGQWHFISHEFSNVSNVRYVEFEHLGRDIQFWAGHYGSKFTGGFLKLCLI